MKYFHKCQTTGAEGNLFLPYVRSTKNTEGELADYCPHSSSAKFFALFPCNHCICFPKCFKKLFVEAMDDDVVRGICLPRKTSGYAGITCPQCSLEVLDDRHMYKILGADYYENFKVKAYESLISVDLSQTCPNRNCGNTFQGHEILGIPEVLCKKCGVCFYFLVFSDFL